jgi:hypothetical protein
VGNRGNEDHGAGKILKTFSCAEIRQKVAIGENTVILSRTSGIRNFIAPSI